VKVKVKFNWWRSKCKIWDRCMQEWQY